MNDTMFRISDILLWDFVPRTGSGDSSRKGIRGISWVQNLLWTTHPLSQRSLFDFIPVSPYYRVTSQYTKLRVWYHS